MLQGFFEVLKTIRENGEDLNKQLKTVQDKQITLNLYGAKWDEELESFIYSYIQKDYYMAMDRNKIHFMVHEEDSYISFEYTMYGEDITIYIDFNTVEYTENLLTGKFIVPVTQRGASLMYKIATGENVPTAYYLGTLTSEKITFEDGEPIESLVMAIKVFEEQGFISSEWSLASFVEDKLQEKKVSKTELAKATDIKYKTLVNKLKMNTLTGEEFIRISIELDIDMNEAKRSYQHVFAHGHKEIDKDLSHIASLITSGFTSGISPFWELSLQQKNLYPLTKAEQLQIAGDIEQGHKAGYLSSEYPREWKLKYEKSERISKHQESVEESDEEKKEQLEKLKENFYKPRI